MNRKLMYAVLSGGLLLGANTLRAQGPPEPSPEAIMPGGPIGGRMEILGFGEMHPGKVVAGAPYSATAVMESKQTLADGNTINRKSQANVFRDGQGRTRRETTLPAVGPLAASGQPKTFVMIHDPVAASAFVLHPDTKVADQLPSHPGAGAHGNHADLQSRFEGRVQKQIADGTLKQEDLGVQTINGIPAQGTRYTRTIPAGQIGNDKPITITSERWYSADLQVVVKSTRNDPRFGETSYTLTNIQRKEPAATLFAVPSDYTVQPAKPHPGFGKGMRPRGGAPANGPEVAPPPPGE